MKYISKSPHQTQEIALKLAKNLRGGEILGLIGELGSGKTCFVRGLAKGLGVKNTIVSPTFIFLKVLPAKNNRNIDHLAHLDLYRLKNRGAIDNIIPLDFLNKKNVVTAIEWAERIKEKLPAHTRFIKFEVLKKNQRKIII